MSPAGVTHQSYWRAGWIVILPASLYATVTVHPIVGGGLLLGYGMGKYVCPDWDLQGVSTSESNMVHDFKILGYLLYGYSSIYGAAFRRWHRSFITHFPFVSTFIRLVFLFWWLGIFIYRGQLIVQPWMVIFALSVWIGLSLADFIHWLLDSQFPDTDVNIKENLRKKEYTSGRIKNNSRKNWRN